MHALGLGVYAQTQLACGYFQAREIEREIVLKMHKIHLACRLLPSKIDVCLAYLDISAAMGPERVSPFMFSQSWQVTDNELHLLADLLLPPYWFFRSSGGRCGKLPATPGL